LQHFGEISEGNCSMCDACKAGGAACPKQDLTADALDLFRAVEKVGRHAGDSEGVDDGAAGGKRKGKGKGKEKTGQEKGTWKLVAQSLPEVNLSHRSIRPWTPSPRPLNPEPQTPTTK
jgi:hypothetical protein